MTLRDSQTMRTVGCHAYMLTCHTYCARLGSASARERILGRRRDVDQLALDQRLDKGQEGNPVHVGYQRLRHAEALRCLVVLEHAAQRALRGGERAAEWSKSGRAGRMRSWHTHLFSKCTYDFLVSPFFGAPQRTCRRTNHQDRKQDTAQCQHAPPVAATGSPCS